MAWAMDSEQPGMPSLTICTLWADSYSLSPTPSDPAMESPSSSTLTGLVGSTAGISGLMAVGTRASVVEVEPGTVVVVVVVVVTVGEATSAVAPTGTSVEAITTPMATAAATGAAMAAFQSGRAPRRMGSSTR
jgi:hypothetical protein